MANRNQNGGYGSGKIPFRERIAVFLQGRNGPDSFYNTLIFICLGIIVFNLFFHSAILSGIEAILLIYAVFRLLSKNVYRRQEENRKFLEIKNRFFNVFRQMKSRIVNRKTNAYRKCPHCKTTLCLPKKPGQHAVTCPCCHNRFEVKI